MRRLPCGSINVPSLSSILSAGKIVKWITQRILYLHTQLHFLISAYTVLSYFCIRTSHFSLCVYSFSLFLYTHLPFLHSAYATLVCFIIRIDHFFILRMQLYPISLYAPTISLFCVCNFIQFHS